MKNYIEIMDTTLRDGEQMRNVAYTSQEKLSLAKILLDEVKVDRIEIASARVSVGEQKSSEGIIEWAKENNYLNKIEILGYVDRTKSVDWISAIGGKVLNLLIKGSMNHLSNQLRKTREEHLSAILSTLEYANNKDLLLNIYLEDWSSGMKEDNDYITFLLDNLQKTTIKRFMLPDTLGILYYSETRQMVEKMVQQYPTLHFDFHGHNDYGLATANTLAAIEGGISGIHLTVNGMGERAGNTALEEVVMALSDHLKINHNINETKLSKISRQVEIFSNLKLASNKPVLGENVYTQTAGLHADGDKKGDLYANLLSPERVGLADTMGKQRVYTLGKLSGMASLEKNLEKLDIDLTADEKKQIYKKIIELGDQKEIITEGDLPYIIADVLETSGLNPFIIKSCVVTTGIKLKPVATVLVEYNGEEIQEYSSGDGGYDAIVKSIRKIGAKFNISLPTLENYTVTIPPGGRTDALVLTTITWSNGESFTTKGLNSDQLLSAIEATEKMVNFTLKMK